jgi:hypothetical protein
MLLILSLIYAAEKYRAVAMDPDADGNGRFCMIEWEYLSDHWEKGYTFNNYQKMIERLNQNEKK